MGRWVVMVEKTHNKMSVLEIKELKILLTLLKKKYGEFDRRCDCLEKAIRIVERDAEEDTKYSADGHWGDEL